MRSARKRSCRSYDPNGNRTSWTDFWGSGSATYDDQDRQLTAGAAVFTYTANGERLTKTQGPDVTTYDYDVRGALLGVDLPNGLEIDYLVDAGGRRIGKKIDGVLTKGWLYAGGLSPVAELDAAGTVTTTFVYATKGNVPDYLEKNGTTYRLLTDHLGSVRLVLDATTGAVAQRLDYDAYGRITFDSSPGFQPFGYAGGLYDLQTGLVRFGARDYNPETGRWTAKDPIGFTGGSAGLYAYVENDPLNVRDPNGLETTYLEDDPKFNQIDYFYCGGFFHSRPWQFFQGYSDWSLPVPTPDSDLRVTRPNGYAYLLGALVGLVLDPGHGLESAPVKTIALGMDIPGGGLKALAELTGASWWKNWARDGITRRNVYRHFGRALHEATDRATTIHFSLDGIDDVADAVRRGAAGFVIDNFTNAELHYLVSNPKLLAKTIFYRGGVVVASPF